MGAGGEIDLVGRDVEIAKFRSLVAATARGTGHAVVLEGEAGIGKSRLAREAVDIARWAGFTAYELACDALRHDDPLQELAQALGVARDDRDAAQLSLLTATAPEPRARFVDSLAAEVANHGHRGPLAIVLEDAQWAEEKTFLATRAIIRRTAALPVLVVVTSRPPVSDAVERGVRVLVEAGADRIAVQPLSRDAVVDLAIAIVGRPPGPRLAELLTGVAGNPLYAIELLRGMSDAELITVSADTAEAAADVLPASLSSQVLGALSDTTADARGVLRLAATLGSRFSLQDLVAVSGRTATQLLAPIEELLRLQLLSDDGERLSFRHDVVREVVYDQVPIAVRTGVHREVADALAKSGAPIARVAAHVMLGAEPGDHEAAEWLLRAARDVIGHDPPSALRFLSRAAEIEPLESPLRPTLLSEQLDALMLSGHLDEADRASSDLLHHLRDRQQIGATQRRRALVLLLQNHPSDAADILERIDGDDGRGDSTLAEASFAALAAADATRARRIADVARDRGHAGRDAVAESLALSVLSRVESMELDLERSLVLARQAVEVADHDTSGEAHRYQPLVFEALSLHDLDRLDEVLDVTEEAHRVASAHGMQFATPLFDGITAFTHLRAGHLVDAARAATAGIAAADDTGAHLATAWCNALRALVALHQDDLVQARHSVDAGNAALSDGPPLLGLDLLVLAGARLQERDGSPQDAVDTLLAMWSAFEDVPAKTMSRVLAPDLVRLAVACDRRDEAERVAAALETAADRVRLPSWQGAALEARGRIEGDLDAFVEAVSAYRTSPRVLELARTYEAAADAFATSNHPADAQRYLEHAVEIYEDAEALHDRGRAVARLRAMGGKVHRTRRTTPGTWSALTAAEREVAQLVAAGLSNPEIAERLFISRRTVETHLRRTFTKLAFTSRVELAVWATQRDPAGS